jgi:transglutaminase-like putative cysteine protease
MTIFTVRHITTYRYRRPVAFGEHRMMFRPRDSYDQRLLEARLAITPEPASLRWMHDVFGNCVAFGRFRGRAAELRFESTIRLDHEPANAPDFQIEEYAKSYPFAYSREEMLDLMPLVGRQYGDQPELDAWVAKFLRPGRKTPTGQLLMTLTCAIAQSFTYMRRSESGTQDPATTLRLGRGTCRDFALLMMEAVRSLGFAARFVSGYLYVPSRDRPGHLGGGSTHAWCQVYLPGAGWVEFDPTNGIIGNRDLIRVAVTRDPSQAIPLSGSYQGDPSHELGMTVDVTVTSEDAAAAPAQTMSEPAL